MTGLSYDEDLNRLTLNNVLSPIQKQGNVENYKLPEDSKQTNYMVTNENLVTERGNSIVEEEETNSIHKSEILTSSDRDSLSIESSSFENYLYNSKEPISISCYESENSTYIQYRSRWFIVASLLLVVTSNFAHRMSFAAVRWQFHQHFTQNILHTKVFCAAFL